jgi:hypothetical protein
MDNIKFHARAKEFHTDFLFKVVHRQKKYLKIWNRPFEVFIQQVKSM